jgi:Cu2+-exporting ATPase
VDDNPNQHAPMSHHGADHAAPTAATATPHDEHAGHDKHAGHDPEAFRRQFWVVLLLTIPVVVWSHEVQMWLGYAAPAFPGSDWVAPILGTIVFLYGGRVFLDGARTELGDRQPGMMTLISLAIVVAFVTSWAATLGIFEVEVWWELATLVTVMSLGHWIEMRSSCFPTRRSASPTRAPCWCALPICGSVTSSSCVRVPGSRPTGSSPRAPPTSTSR